MSSHIELKQPLSVELAEELLVQIVTQFWGGRVHVVRKPERESPTLGPTHRVWSLCVPGSSLRGAEATNRWLTPGDDYGFSIHFQHNQFEFRHPQNSWEHWAMRKVRQEVAKTTGGALCGDEPFPLVEVNSDLKATYREYILFLKNGTMEDDWVQHMLWAAPPGFRD